jgi:NAD(P)-dependent dehydrogenase (short-subunit alcohol dehydrogenase family)
MKNKTVLITGGTSGIGLATARLLQNEGARIIVTGRNPETLAAAQATLGPGAAVLASDSGRLDDARQLGNAVRTVADRLDGVFLNAGIAQFGPIEAVTADLFDAMFDINVRGVFFQLQALLGLLANPSSVLLTASVVAELGLPGASVYSATKAAVVSLGKTFAVELAPRGIRVNTLSPGPIATPIFGKMGLGSEGQKGFESQMAAQSLLKRVGTPEEVARVARFLLSPDSSYLIGADVTVDGGIRLT